MAEVEVSIEPEEPEESSEESSEETAMTAGHADAVAEQASKDATDAEYAAKDAQYTAESAHDRITTVEESLAALATNQQTLSEAIMAMAGEQNRQGQMLAEALAAKEETDNAGEQPREIIEPRNTHWLHKSVLGSGE